MTYINCILKLTVLPTEAIAEVPGVGKGLSAFKRKSSMHGAESLFVVSQGKAVIQAMLQPCAHSDSSLQKAICPPESSAHKATKATSQTHPCPMRQNSWTETSVMEQESRIPGKWESQLLQSDSRPRGHLPQGNSPNQCPRGISLGQPKPLSCHQVDRRMVWKRP